MRQKLNDCYFVYALKQSDIPEDVINKIKFVFNACNLSPSRIDKLYSDHQIHCKYTYINKEMGISKEEISYQQKMGNKDGI